MNIRPKIKHRAISAPVRIKEESERTAQRENEYPLKSRPRECRKRIREQIK